MCWFLTERGSLGETRELSFIHFSLSVTFSFVFLSFYLRLCNPLPLRSLLGSFTVLPITAATSKAFHVVLSLNS